MNKTRMSDEILMENGYKKYPWKTHAINAKAIDTLFQKKVADEKGIKYFINVTKTEANNSYIGWEIDMQLETKHGAVNFVLLQWFNAEAKNKTSIVDMENYLDNIFKLHDEPYYEKYD